MIAFLGEIGEEEGRLAQKFCAAEDSHRPRASFRIVSLANVATLLKLLLPVSELVKEARRPSNSRALACELRTLTFVTPSVHMRQVVSTVDIAVGVDDAVLFEVIPREYGVQI